MSSLIEIRQLLDLNSCLQPCLKPRSKPCSKPCSKPSSKPCSKPCSTKKLNIYLIKHVISKNYRSKEERLLVNEFLKTRQNIQQNFLSERVGDVNTQYELSKLFIPVTDMQKDLKEGLVGELKPIREGMKNLPRAIILPQFPSITAYDDDGEEVDVFIEDIPEQYLRKFASASGTDKTLGLRDKDSKFNIGNKKAKKRKTI